MNGPRISIILPNLRGGGAERVNMSLAQEFLERGCAVDFVLMRRVGEMLDLIPEGARVIDLETPRTRGLFGPLTAYIRQRKPDALLAGIWPLTSMTALCHRLARAKCPVAVVDHNTLSRQYSTWGRIHRSFLRASIAATYRLADARVAVSCGVADDLAALAGIGRGRFQVIHNPIPAPADTDGMARAAAERCWGEHRGPRILTVGSFKAQKNHAVLVRAFARMANLGGARLMLLGEGELRSEIEALVTSLGLDDKVLMPGFMADPVAFYRTADLFVLSSDYEGLPTVLIEALACGLPVVSTDCPSGAAEILENGRWGHMVPVGDVDALASAMTGALSTNHDREALKLRAADFTPAIAADKYLKLLLPGWCGRLGGITNEAII